MTLQKKPPKPRKLLISVTDLRVSHCDTTSTLDGTTAIPLPEITCPRKLTSFNQNSHLDNLAYSFFSFNTCNTIFKCSACSSSVLEYIKMSSIKTTTN